MRKLSLARVLDCFSLPASSTSCLCARPVNGGGHDDDDDDDEGVALVKFHADQTLKLEEVDNGCKTLAFHLEPKRVELRVSMHCNGCARKVQKHIAKIEGVTSFEVDLENKKVVVMGDITPFEVLDSVSKIKFAELWLGA